MNKKALFCFFIISLLSGILSAQPTLDTISACLRAKPSFFAKVDSRNSFIENSRAQIIGVKAGVSYAKRLFFGIGYNQLYKSNSSFYKQIYYTNNLAKPDSINAKLRMYYISLHAEYIFYRAGKWQLSMPIQFGIGQTYYSYIINSKKFRVEENSNFIYEPGISIEYKFVRWAGIGADAGYRFLITGDKSLSRNFTSPTYAFKFLIYYGELYRSVFGKKEKTKN